MLHQEFHLLLDHKKLKELKINNQQNMNYFDKTQKTYLMSLKDLHLKQKISLKNKTNIVFQILINSRENLKLQFYIQSNTNQKKWIMFSPNFKSTQESFFHIKIPFTGFQTNSWMNMVVDLQSYAKGTLQSEINAIEEIKLQGDLVVKAIFLVGNNNEFINQEKLYPYSVLPNNFQMNNEIEYVNGMYKYGNEFQIVQQESILDQFELQESDEEDRKKIIPKIRVSQDKQKNKNIKRIQKQKLEQKNTKNFSKTNLVTLSKQKLILRSLNKQSQEDTQLKKRVTESVQKKLNKNLEKVKKKFGVIQNKVNNENQASIKYKKDSKQIPTILPRLNSKEKIEIDKQKTIDIYDEEIKKLDEQLYILRKQKYQQEDELENENQDSHSEYSKEEDYVLKEDNSILSHHSNQNENQEPLDIEQIIKQQLIQPEQSLQRNIIPKSDNITKDNQEIYTQNENKNIMNDDNEIQIGNNSLEINNLQTFGNPISFEEKNNSNIIEKFSQQLDDTNQKESYNQFEVSQEGQHLELDYNQKSEQISINKQLTPLKLNLTDLKSIEKNQNYEKTIPKSIDLKDQNIIDTNKKQEKPFQIKFSEVEGQNYSITMGNSFLQEEIKIYNKKQEIDLQDNKLEFPKTVITQIQDNCQSETKTNMKRYVYDQMLNCYYDPETQQYFEEILEQIMSNYQSNFKSITNTINNINPPQKQNPYINFFLNPSGSCSLSSASQNFLNIPNVVFFTLATSIFQEDQLRIGCHSFNNFSPLGSIFNKLCANFQLVFAKANQLLVSDKLFLKNFLSFLLDLQILFSFSIYCIISSIKIKINQSPFSD